MKTLKIFLAVMAIAIAASCSTTYRVTEVKVPLKHVSDTKEAFVAYASFTSPEMNLAKFGAENECRGALSQKIETRVKAATETYRSQAGGSTIAAGIVKDYEEMTEYYVRSLSNASFNGLTEVENKCFYNERTRQYTYWVSMAVKRSDVIKAIDPQTPTNLSGRDRTIIETHRKRFVDSLQEE